MGEKSVTSPWKGWNVNATPAPTLFEDVMSQVKKWPERSIGKFRVMRYMLLYHCNAGLQIQGFTMIYFELEAPTPWFWLAKDGLTAI